MLPNLLGLGFAGAAVAISHNLYRIRAIDFWVEDVKNLREYDSTYEPLDQVALP